MYLKNLNKFITASGADDKANVILVTGPAGAGKTGFVQVLASTLAYSYCKMSGRNHRPVVWCCGDEFCDYDDEGLFCADLSQLIPVLQVAEAAGAQTVIDITCDNLDDLIDEIHRAKLTCKIIYLRRPLSWYTQCFECRHESQPEDESLNNWLSSSLDERRALLHSYEKFIRALPDVTTIDLRSTKFPAIKGSSVASSYLVETAEDGRIVAVPETLPFGPFLLPYPRAEQYRMPAVSLCVVSPLILSGGDSDKDRLTLCVSAYLPIALRATRNGRLSGLRTECSDPATWYDASVLPFSHRSLIRDLRDVKGSMSTTRAVRSRWDLKA